MTKKQKKYSEFGTRFHREVPLFVEMSAFPYSTMQDMPRETSSVPKTSSVSSFAVLTERRLVKDRQTDGRTDGRTERHRAVAYNALCLCGVSAGAERVGH